VTSGAPTPRRELGPLRLAALVGYYAIAQHIPAWPGPIGGLGFVARRILARRLFAACGPDLNLHAGVAFGSGRHLHAANNVGIGQGTVFNGRGEVYLGAHLTMGPGCLFLTGSHEASSRRPLREQAGIVLPIRIGADVYLGARVILLPGVNVGDGAVVGAGAVVSKDVEPYTIVAGNPIRVIGRRA
jgi:maltose O-acetyltransferase